MKDPPSPLPLPTVCLESTVVWVSFTEWFDLAAFSGESQSSAHLREGDVEAPLSCQFPLTNSSLQFVPPNPAPLGTQRPQPMISETDFRPPQPLNYEWKKDGFFIPVTEQFS